MHFWSGCHDNGYDVFIKQAVLTAWVHVFLWLRNPPDKHNIYKFTIGSLNENYTIYFTLRERTMTCWLVWIWTIALRYKLSYELLLWIAVYSCSIECCVSSYSFCFVLFFINSLHSYNVCCNVRIYWNIDFFFFFKYCVKSNVIPTSAAMKKRKRKQQHHCKSL